MKSPEGVPTPKGFPQCDEFRAPRVPERPTQRTSIEFQISTLRRLAATSAPVTGAILNVIRRALERVQFQMPEVRFGRSFRNLLLQRGDPPGHRTHGRAWDDVSSW